MKAYMHGSSGFDICCLRKAHVAWQPDDNRPGGLASARAAADVAAGNGLTHSS